MLQPFEYDPNEKNRHKFLVQSLVVPDGPVANQEQWVRYISLMVSNSFGVGVFLKSEHSWSLFECTGQIS